MRVAHAEGRDWRLELKTISSWHTAPTRTQLPARDLLSYFMGGKFPLHYWWLQEFEELEYQQTRDRDAVKKQIGADYVDKRHYATERPCVAGEEEGE